MKLDDALEFVIDAFGDKKDRAGELLWKHCFRVMQLTNDLLLAPHPENADILLAALLHDTVEDTWHEPSDLLAAGFSELTVKLVVLLTHDKDAVSYQEYLEIVATDWRALLIKLADNLDNSDPERQARGDILPGSFLHTRYETARPWIIRRLAEIAP